MTRKTSILLVLVLAATAVVASPTNYPRGVTRISTPNMQPGWVVFTASDGNAYIIDQFGVPANQWTSPDPDNPVLGHAEAIFDTPGHVLVMINPAVVEGCEPPDCGKVIELDWDNNLVWEYDDTERLIHHDVERLPNGNTLMMCSKTIDRPEIAPVPIIDDCLIEVAPDGTIVWEWQTADHYDELDLTDEERALIAANPGGPTFPGDWAHGNAIDSIPPDTPHTDPRFREGNVIVSYRHINLVIVVDRDTGEVVWQNRMSIGQHHSHMITTGLRGHGNILVFDNGFGGMYPPVARFNSRVIEIDPLTDEIVWEYNAALTGIPVWSFYTSFVGSAERLPNGNTIINEGMFGRVFEVTEDHRMAWEFINPTANDGFGFVANIVYRYNKVPVDWAGPIQAVDWPESGRVHSVTQTRY